LSVGNVARDGDGRNSPYTEALLENIAKPGLTISDVFINVRTKVKKETGQVPWELSSLEGRFYFAPQVGRQNDLSDASSYAPRPVSDEIVQQNVALERERQELARDKQEIERQKTLEAEREQLAAERRKIESERQQLAMGKRQSVSTAGETARDGRFIAYNNGTVLDTKTNLMWAGKDNGSDINWENAKSYCDNYRGGGYSDWRMPTQDELAGLYDASKSRPAACNRNYKINIVTELIDITCFSPWASETRRSDAAYFTFDGGTRYWYPKSMVNYIRALPVRIGK
jgi:hypothetical protein